MFLKELKERDLFYQIPNENAKIRSIYCGFDATAPSLQIGNLTPITTLRLAAKHNIPIFVLLGGCTTQVGDPSGKNTTRKKLELDNVDSNMKAIEKQIKHLLPEAKIVNNAEWLGDLSFMTFLNEVALYYPLSSLIKLKTFAARLENHDPLNVQEALYPLMQGYDFMWLYKHKGCNTQIGGQDQWCNILPGIDLIKKKYAGEDAVALTMPLLTDSEGRKMGKSEKGAVYLEDSLCSVFDFWQFWRNVEDPLVATCLLRFTLINPEKIQVIVDQDINEAKILLANEVTAWVHGQEKADEAATLVKKVFSGDLEDLKVNYFEHKKLLQVVAALKNITNSAAKQLIKQHAIKLNEVIIEDVSYDLEKGEFILKIGKKEVFKVCII